MKTKVFLSHPFASNPELNKKCVKNVEKMLLNKGVVPFSPLGAFRMYEEDDDRELILELCEGMIKCCDEIWIFFYDNDELSSGQKFEAEVAFKNNIPIRYFKLKRSNYA